jgi:tetratricopeptide (TPR) repeat protein
MSRALPWTGFAQKIKDLSVARRDDPEEVRLYYRRACLAAAEERWDVALIFCDKALEIDPRDLPTRLLVARIHDRGLDDVDGAVAAYRKVITLAAYDGRNPYCTAAKEALDALVQRSE